MTKKAVVLSSLFLACLPVWARKPMPTMYISASNGFSTALTAAMIKKHVPVTVVLNNAHAEYELKASKVDSKDATGAGKIARCLFIDCVGLNGYSSVSVELIKNSTDAIVWAYQVRKGNSGPLGIQSLSEAIAKHLKKDYLRKHHDS